VRWRSCGRGGSGLRRARRCRARRRRAAPANRSLNTSLCPAPRSTEHYVAWSCISIMIVLRKALPSCSHAGHRCARRRCARRRCGGRSRSRCRRAASANRSLCPCPPCCTHRTGTRSTAHPTQHWVAPPLSQKKRHSACRRKSTSRRVHDGPARWLTLVRPCWVSLCSESPC
jgi:hypothetical protein